MVRETSEIWRRSRKLWSLLRVPAYRRALASGVAATVEHESVPFDPNHSTVIDAGSGRGQFAIFARHRFPKAKIHCIEPVPESSARAKKALRGIRGIELHSTAVGSQAGQAVIHVTADFDSSSLRQPTGEQARRFPGTTEVGELAVDVRTLDELFQCVDQPALLKLDLQGGELEALTGAESLLGMVTEVFVECSFVELYEGQPLAEDVIDFVVGRGFSLHGIFSTIYGADGVCIQGDLLFKKRVSPDLAISPPG